MAQAMEFWFATPITTPRLPRISSPLGRSKSPAMPYPPVRLFAGL